MTTLQRVIKILAEQAGASENDFSASTRLEDVGIDSLEYVDFIGTLRHEIKDVRGEVLMSAQTLGDLALALD
jgi:acyl carrier protein